LEDGIYQVISFMQKTNQKANNPFIRFSFFNRFISFNVALMLTFIHILKIFVPLTKSFDRLTSEK